MSDSSAAEAVLRRPPDVRHDLLEVEVRRGRAHGLAEEAFSSELGAWTAAERLVNEVRVVSPREAVATRQARLRSAPRPESPAVTEVLLGDPLELFDSHGRWMRVRTESDRYLGWLPRDTVAIAPYEATHRVQALRAHAFASPRVQGQVTARLSWGSRLRQVASEGSWAKVVLPDGVEAYVAKAVLAAAAETRPVVPLQSSRWFLGTPYLWGGASAWGIDCSGFIQLLWRMAGAELPRDSDEQAAAGQAVSDPQPGDVAVFPDHIALYLGDELLIHSGATAMTVQVDDLRRAQHLADALDGFVRLPL